MKLNELTKTFEGQPVKVKTKKERKEMDKFIIKPQSKSKGYKPALITIETHELLTQVKEETGVTMTRFIEEAVRFALDRLEIKED